LDTYLFQTASCAPREVENTESTLSFVSTLQNSVTTHKEANGNMCRKLVVGWFVVRSCWNVWTRQKVMRRWALAECLYLAEWHHCARARLPFMSISQWPPPQTSSYFFRIKVINAAYNKLNFHNVYAPWMLDNKLYVSHKTTWHIPLFTSLTDRKQIIFCLRKLNWSLLSMIITIRNLKTLQLEYAHENKREGGAC
jgi:hypothetical protein